MDVETIRKVLEAVNPLRPYRLIVEPGRVDVWLREEEWVGFPGPVLEAASDPEGVRLRIAVDVEAEVWLWCGGVHAAA